MTWIKLDDKCPRHPKVAGLSDRAFRWWVQALCYASEFLTDGLLPASFLRTVPARVKDELLTSGLWFTQDVEWRIHDYLTHQTGRAEIERERDRNRRRRTGGVPAVQPPVVPPDDQQKTATRSRSREQNSENRTPPKNGGEVRGGGAIRSPLEYEKALKFNVFVGARLDVPLKIHGDFVRQAGPTSAPELLAWYSALDAEIEVSGEMITPDVWKWLESRFKPWLIERVNAEETRKFMEQA